jgi:hypothetical protein
MNPFRVALMLFRLIREMQEDFNFSEHSSKLMEETLVE